MRTLIVVFVVSSFVGCAGDSDGDLLPDKQELSLGLDPKDQDSDGDGLDDLTELRWTLTDPLSADSDEDGDGDAEEITFGFDPLDSDSHSFQDGWPIAPVAIKDAIVEPSPGARLRVGEVMPRFLFSAPERRVDGYDFAGQGVPVLFGGGPQDGAGQANAWVPQRLEMDAVPSSAVRDAVEEGAVLFAALATYEYRQPVVGPPTEPSGTAWCSDSPFRCLSEESMAAWSWSGQFEGDIWILVDETMVVRAIGKTEPGLSRVDFTTLEAVLFTLIDAP